MTVFTKVAVDVFAPTDAAGNLRSVVNGETQVWGAEVERAIQAAISAGALVYGTKAELDADLDHDEHTGAWVVADPDPANNGIYEKVGASGTGSWEWRSGIPTGPKGWSPLLRIITDGQRRVLEVYDWTGGEGVKPTETGYIGASGLTSVIADAIDIRGPEGPNGPGTGDMLRSNNLSDVDSVTESQRNIAYAAAFATEIVADGVIDAVASLVALEAEAEEVIRLKNATYYIGTDYTPTKTLRFSSGTKFLIADGVTVDFSEEQPEIRAPKKQRFYFDGTGTGSVVGLDVSWNGWFAGDKLDTDNNALPELKKWAASVAVGGQLRMVRNRVSSDGSEYIVCGTRPSIIGQNREASKIRFLGTETRGFQFTSASGTGGHIQDVGFDRLQPLVAPTVGWAVDWQQRIWTAERVRGDNLWGGFITTGGWGKFRDCDFTDTRTSCIRVDNCNETQGNTGIFAANASWVTLTNVNGTFVHGESFSFAGGTGVHIYTSGTDGTHYKVATTGYEVPVGATITGDTSGATAEIASITHGHQVGAIRLLERCHASKFAFIEVSGGEYPLLIDASAEGTGTQSLSSKFTACHFDSAKTSAAAINYAVGTQFLACWFSSFAEVEQDVFLNATDATTFIACQWTSTNKRCLTASATSTDTQIIGGVMANINKQDEAGIPAIRFAPGSTGVVRDVTIGADYGYSQFNFPKVGIEIGAGCVVRVDNVDASACATPILDNSGGTAKITNCPGYRTANSGTDTMPTGGTVVVNHGLSVAPAHVEITPRADPQVRYFVPTANINGTSFTVACNAAPASAWGFSWKAVGASAV